MSAGECILPKAVAERMSREIRARFPDLFAPPGVEPIVVTIRVNDSNRARIEDLAEGGDLDQMLCRRLAQRAEAGLRDDMLAIALGLPRRADMKPAKVTRIR